MAEDWRIIEALKIIRQGRRCEIPSSESGDIGCGAFVGSEEAWIRHQYWHNLLLQKIGEIDAHFDSIEEYVIDPQNGMEKRIVDEFLDLRADTTEALNLLRNDATTAINQLRTDATNAITALQGRVTALEGILG